jgi:Arc/MetJ-type ribon-helix-helix transcriptional regulator
MSVTINPTKETPTMSTITIELDETLQAFVENQISNRGYASAGEYLRALLEEAIELRDVQMKLQEGLDAIDRGEFSLWKPGDSQRRVEELIQERLGK